MRNYRDKEINMFNLIKMKKFLIMIALVLATSTVLAQPRFMTENTTVENQAPQFRPMGRMGIPGMTNIPQFRGWGGMFNFAERGFEPVFNLNTPKLSQVRVYISEIPEFEKRFSRKRNTVVTFEIPDSAGMTLLRFYGVNETIDFLKTVKSVMEDIQGKGKLSKKENDAYVKQIKKAMPQSAYFWDDYAGFNNKIEPIIIHTSKDSEPMIVLEGVSYCRIKFKDLSSIIDPGFSGDDSISCEIQLPFNGVDEITRMIERLNFSMNMPRIPQFGMRR